MSELVRSGECICREDPSSITDLIGKPEEIYRYELIKDLHGNFIVKIFLDGDNFQTCSPDIFGRFYFVVLPTTTTRAPLKPPLGFTAEDYRRRFNRKDEDHASGGN